MVVLSCHRGLSAEEIVVDCLEKAKALTQVGLGYMSDLNVLPTAYISLLDDVLELGLKHCELIGAFFPCSQALVRSERCPVD